MSPASFEVAFICTGNRFRSPLAAALLASRTGELPLQASSLGTLDLGSVGALSEAVEVGRSLGVDLSGHRTRCMTQVDLEPFDLIVCFEWTHLQAAIIDGQAPIERTFTLPELVELLRELPESEDESAPVERARSRVEQAHALRPEGFRGRRPPEIPDPLGKPPTAQRQIADEVRELVIELERLLFS